VTVRTDFKKSEETGRIHNFMAAGKREGRGFAVTRMTTPTSTRSSKAPPIRYPPIPTRSSRRWGLTAPGCRRTNRLLAYRCRFESELNSAALASA
jgi:hypothetical protein